MSGFADAMHATADVQLRELSLGPLVDRGGQGEVWAFSAGPEFLFKKYLVQPINEEALARLVVFPGSLSAADRQLLFERTAWPINRVCDGTRAVGFIMRRASEAFCSNVGRAGPPLRELQYLLFPASPLWGDIKPIDAVRRILLLRETVRLLRMLHARKVVLGDISMLNILWSDTATPTPFMLDCDSATLDQKPPVLPSAHTVDWDDPLLSGGTQEIDSDRYKLALLVGRVLTANAYTRPGEVLTLMPGVDARVHQAVTACFDRAAGAFGTRPDADDWARALSGRDSIPLTPLPPVLPMPTLPGPTRGGREAIPMRPLPRRT